MDLDWLPPAITGGAISLASALSTGALQRRSDRKRDRREYGRERAELVLDSLVTIRTKHVEGKRPAAGDRYGIPQYLIEAAGSKAQLIPDSVVRNTTVKGLSCLNAVAMDIPDLPDLPHRVQRTILAEIEVVVSAYCRGDRVPRDVAARVTSVYQTVDAFWTRAIKAGDAVET